jgi:hypothetical protein
LELGLLPKTFPLPWCLQQFGRLDVESDRNSTDDPEACVKRTLFKLAQIAPTDFGLICKVILRQAFSMSQTAQIDGKYLSQVHARSQANCLKFTPRYTEQRDQKPKTLY